MGPRTSSAGGMCAMGAWLEGGPPFPALYLTGNVGQCSLLLMLLLSLIGGRLLVVLPASRQPG
jgi:hypothetical protein